MAGAGPPALGVVMTSRRYRVQVGERTLEVEVREEQGQTLVLVDGVEMPAGLSAPDAAGLRRLTLGQGSRDVLAVPGSDHCLVGLEGVALDVRVEDERAARLARFGGGAARGSGHATVAAPMPGLVVRVNVAPGDTVQEGQSLVVLQAMKMENELASPRGATVKAVRVEPGQAVEQGQVLVELE